MKKILYSVLFAVIGIAAVSQLMAQPYYDTAKYSIAASIKPSDFPDWPDGVAAWRVYGPYDLDNNGKKEMLVVVDPASTSSDTGMPWIYRFEATGNNTYSVVWHTQIPYQNTALGSWPCVEVGDLDKDGNPEIIFGLPTDARTSVDPNPDRIFIYEYDPGTKNFPAEPTMTSKLGFPDQYYFAVTSIVANDVDNDGDVEMILSARRAYGGGMGTASTRPLFIYHLLGDVSQGFSSFELEFADTIGTFDGGYYFNNHVVDFDGNGKKEIWGFTWDMLSFAVYEATGKDTYTLKADVNQATAPDDYGEQNSVQFFDANKDGKLEMFIGGQLSPPSAVFYVGNTSDLTTLSTASVKRISPVLETANFQGATGGDVDGDGEFDFFIGNWDLPIVYQLSHIASKPYDDTSGYKLDTLYYSPGDSNYTFTNVYFMNDLDGDQKNEVILANTDTRVDHPEDVSLVILESKVVVTGVKTISDQAPNSFSLEQNFPNPFNPSSTIRFSLGTASNVELFISNSLGQRVATLLNRRMENGTHEVTFNADGLASGTYFYTLKSGDLTQTKKMILMK